MKEGVSRFALLLGFGSATLLVILELFYATALIFGLASLPEPNDPIGDPFFTAMEVLIIIIAPAMILLAVSIASSCHPTKRPVAMASVVFVAILAAITTSIHSSILFLSREPAFANMSHIFSFEWPSVVYVLDILAWDFFFGLFAVCLALSFERRGLDSLVSASLMICAAISFAGLWGAAIGNMQLRNIGILGYVGVFTISAGLIAIHMWRRLDAES